jgi:hypothetical protein
MTIIDYAWLRYADLQQRSRKAQELNDYAWGIEAALNYLLRVLETGTIPFNQLDLDAALSRAIASGARLRRSRSFAQRKWLIPPDALSTNSAAEASFELDRIGRDMRGADAEILLDAGFGYTDREIACRHTSTPGAVRVRLSRLRRNLIEQGRSEVRPATRRVTAFPVSALSDLNSPSKSQAA